MVYRNKISQDWLIWIRCKNSNHKIIALFLFDYRHVMPIIPIFNINQTQQNISASLFQIANPQNKSTIRIMQLIKSTLLFLFIILILQVESSNRNLQFFTPPSYDYSYKKPLDPYINVQPPQPPRQPIQYKQYPQSNIKTFSPNSNNRNSNIKSFSPTSNQRSNPLSRQTTNQQTQFPSSSCQLPLVSIGGICKCPNNQEYLSGRCYSRKPREQKPQAIYKPPSCELPRKIIWGKCQCPNNQIFQYGRCNSRSNERMRIQQIRPIKNYYGKEPLKKIFRDYNGKNNNKNNRDWGALHAPLQRRIPPNFKDGIGAPLTYLPNPRYISNEFIALNRSPERSRNSITMAFVIWGQFLDHDIDLTEPQEGTEQFNIKIPKRDRFFSGQTQIKFHRSTYIQRGPYRPRQFPNQITAWIDGSQIYGSEQKKARSLRSFKNGELRTSGGRQNLLPRVDDIEDPHNMFDAGDIRSNENIILSSYHTIFVRQHNRVCQQILRQNPDMNDEEVFQAARNYVIALLQKISLEDFLPILLGVEYPRIVKKYSGYMPNINPDIPVQFSTAAYRVGHGLIVDTYPLINQYGYKYREMKLRDMYFRPNLINSRIIDDLFRGLSKNVMKQKGPSMIDELRNLLTLDPEKRETKVDLFALSIQRSRDHGLPSYNQAREAYGLKKFRSFYEIVRDQEKAEILRNVYRGQIDDVELFIGILGEQPVQGGVLGELGCQIVGQTFRNIRDADRLWYENSFPGYLIQQIKRTSLSDIIRRNTGIKSLSKDIFHA